MPELVGRDRFFQISVSRDRPDDRFVDRRLVEGIAPLRKKQRSRIQSSSFQHVLPRLIQIELQVMRGVLPNWQDPRFSSFSFHHRHGLFFQIHILYLEIAKLTGANPAGVEELDDRPISNADGISRLGVL